MVSINQDLSSADTLKDNPHPEQLSWYLVHTYPKKETVALTNLTRQGYECFMPMIKLEKIRRRKVMIVEEAMFKRYLFIRLDSSGYGKSWLPIRSTLGVNRLVRFGGLPAKVNEELIDLLRSREKHHQMDVIFSVGESVVITEGPFTGLEAIYQAKDAESRSIILLDILSKQVTISIDTASLSKPD